MRDYAKIYTSVWRSRKFRNLPNEGARHLYLYLHTCPHSNMIGCYVLPTEYALSDLRWQKDAYLEAIDSLCRADLIGFDAAEEVVRIVDFISHDPFTNERHAIGAIKIAYKVPNCLEKQRLMLDLVKAKHVKPAMIARRESEAQDSLKIGSSPEPPPEPEPEPEQYGGGGGVRGRETTDREAILEAIGVDPVSGITGPSARMLGTQADMAEFARWMELPGITASVAIEEVRRVMANKRDGPPSSFRFFTKAIQRLSGELSRPALDPTQPTGARHDRQRFDQTIDAVAAGLSSGAIGLGLESRNPFAKRSGGDPQEGEHGPGPVLRSGQ